MIEWDDTGTFARADARLRMTPSAIRALHQFCACWPGNDGRASVRVALKDDTLRILATDGVKLLSVVCRGIGSDIEGVWYVDADLLDAAAALGDHRGSGVWALSRSRLRAYLRSSPRGRRGDPLFPVVGPARLPRRRPRIGCHRHDAPNPQGRSPTGPARCRPARRRAVVDGGGTRASVEPATGVPGGREEAGSRGVLRPTDHHGLRRPDRDMARGDHAAQRLAVVRGVGRWRMKNSGLADRSLYVGGYLVVDAEKWWTALQAAETRAETAAQEEREAIVHWLRESVGSGPATLLADEISTGAHRSESTE